MYFSEMLKAGQDLAGLQKNLDRMSDLVGEAVKLLWHNSTITQPAALVEKKQYPSVVLVLTRHVCEYADSVAIHTRQGAADPCKLPLRSTIEAALSIYDVLEPASESEQRGLAYHVAHAHQKIKLFNKLEPAKQAPHAAYIAGLQSMLAKAEYAPIGAEWKAQKKKFYNVKWFSLFNGHKGLREIAEAAGKPELYNTFYSLYSGTMHAADCFDKIGKGATDEQKVLKPLRHPEQLQAMVLSAVSLCSMVGKMLLNRWGTDEQKAQAQKTYEAKIQPDFRFLTDNPELIEAPWR